MAKILLVDDDTTLLGFVETALKAEHIVETASTGNSASELLRFYDYSLVVLDWDLPGKSGVEILKELRSYGKSGDRGRTPVLMLTGKREVDEKEEGLDAGADDYLTKPFELRELRARIAALLRRSQFAGKITTAGGMKLDLENLSLAIDGREVQLLRREVEVLERLMRAGSEYLSTEALLEQVWGDGNQSPSGLISCIKRLRDKVDLDGQLSFIETAPKLGYRLRPR